MAKIEADIVVVGAGLVGLSAAIAFAKRHKKVVLLDAKKPETSKKSAWDARIYALTPSSEAWLQSLNVWQHVDLSRVSAINAMHLWDGNDEKLVLSDSDANLPKLGVIIENQNLQYALWQQINASGVTVVTDAKCSHLENTVHGVQLRLANETEIVTKLVVAADGVNSWVREQVGIGVKQIDFHQTAIVANFSAEKTHQNIARQWFAPHETLALLPLVGKNVSLVWSVLTERAGELLKLSSADLAEQVAQQAKYALGDLQPIGKTLSFTLSQQTATQLVAERVALVGDAAHQIHPMAGQGMNLGFRDVMAIEAHIASAHSMRDIGELAFLRQYARERRMDIASMNTLTTGLDFLFASENVIVKKAMNWGLRQLNGQAAIKKLLIQQAVA